MFVHLDLASFLVYQPLTHKTDNALQRIIKLRRIAKNSVVALCRISFPIAWFVPMDCARVIRIDKRVVRAINNMVTRVVVCLQAYQKQMRRTSIFLGIYVKR